MLPEAFTKYLHDAEMTLGSWDANTRTLGIHVVKDIGPEKGLLVFTEVNYLAVATNFSSDGAKALFVLDCSDEDWPSGAPVRADLDKSNIICFLYSVDGGLPGCVIAEKVEYHLAE